MSYDDEQLSFFFGSNDPRVRAFLDHHERNPAGYELFERFALEAARSRNRFSSNAIMSRIRWFTRYESVGDAFKINDHWSPFYSRIFLHRHSEYAHLFVRRKAAADTMEIP
jgi:hypothetical protein